MRWENNRDERIRQKTGERGRRETVETTLGARESESSGGKQR